MKLREKRDRQLAALKPLGELIDSEKCTDWLAAELHAGSPPDCPACGKAPTGSTLEKLQEGHRIRCQACGKGWNIWSGTLFEGAKITPVDFILLRVALVTGLDQATGWMQNHGFWPVKTAWSTSPQGFSGTGIQKIT
jgi:hypothetical protein